MSLKVAVQMDPIELITIGGDTTFAMMLEAQARGHELWVYVPERLSLRDGEPFARMIPTRVTDRQGEHAEQIDEARETRLSECDVVLLRQDPPFDMAYITTTYLLDAVHPRTLVVNDPIEVRNAPEKLLVTRYPELTPPTLITRDREQVRAFREEHGEIILKPLYGNGGAGVFRIREDDENLSSLLELFEADSREPYVVQAYLPAVRGGDKRVLLIEGEPVAAINRVPAKGEARSNMHVGGRAEPSEVDARDREICAAIGPELRRRGLLFAGIDVIGGRLTEINVTSPTGVREVERFGGPNVAALFWDAVEARRAGAEEPAEPQRSRA